MEEELIPTLTFAVFTATSYRSHPYIITSTQDAFRNRLPHGLDGHCLR